MKGGEMRKGQQKSTARVLHSISELCHVCRADHNCQLVLSDRAPGLAAALAKTVAPNRIRGSCVLGNFRPRSMGDLRWSPSLAGLSVLRTSYSVLRTSMIGGSADRHSLTLSIASRTRVLKHVQRVGFKWARDRGVCSPVRSTENGERKTE